MPAVLAARCSLGSSYTLPADVNHVLHPPATFLLRIGTALVIGGLVARGMHRGGLDRTSAKTKQSPVKAGFPAGGPRGHKLPMSTIPVIETDGQGDEEAPLLADDEKQGHGGGTTTGRHIVQLQASAGPPGGGGLVSAAGLAGGGGRPSASPKPSTATRRKAAEANNPFG